ncbi:hypothetical protein [Bradyrhizobium sp. UFLA05-112]
MKHVTLGCLIALLASVALDQAGAQSFGSTYTCLLYTCLNRALAAKEPAAQVWFQPFNSTEHTVEWRAEGTKPFAIIQRWRIADGTDLNKEGRPNTKAMLAVTRLPPGPVCHVACVDVKANANANELARQAADQYARDFTCGKDEVKVIGTSGRAIELARR